MNKLKEELFYLRKLCRALDYNDCEKEIKRIKELDKIIRIWEIINE